MQDAVLKWQVGEPVEVIARVVRVRYGEVINMRPELLLTLGTAENICKIKKTRKLNESLFIPNFLNALINLVQGAKIHTVQYSIAYKFRAL